MERESVAENSKQKDGSESISVDSATESRESSSSTSSASRLTSDYSCSARLGWPIRRAASCMKIGPLGGKSDSHFNIYEESKLKQGSKASEMEMMKERFAKLLLGEDMSGSGKGVCSALTISNAITNLCATMFGQLWRLEPLPSAKKSMWIREMEWLLAVSDHIVEMMPSWKTFPDGSKLEVMNCRPRSDLAINLPALCKLDNMLLEILDGFTNTEFWYIDQGIAAPGTDGSDSFQKAIQRDDDKWWLPLPRVPPDGLSEDTRRQLVHKRECATQILKAATAINSVALAEMEVPVSYLETLPKSGRTCLGDVIYRYITTEKFSPDCLLDCLDLSSEHAALEIANRVEAAIYVWRKRQQPKITANTQPSKLSWEIVMDLMVYGDKTKILAERAESLLLLLKQRFPGLTQTTLDVSKIQCNKDVGKAILESYSRVLESLAFNVVARIEDLLYVDNINNNSDKHLGVTAVSFTPHKKAASVSYSVPAPGTPYRTASTTPDLFPATPLNPARDEIIPLIPNKPSLRAFGVKKALSNYLGGDAKAKINANVIPCSATDSNRAGYAITSNPNLKGKESCYSLLNESRAGEVVER